MNYIWTKSHLRLEADDCDKETDCSCDAQTHHHRLGVIEAFKTRNMQIMVKKFKGIQYISLYKPVSPAIETTSHTVKSIKLAEERFGQRHTELHHEMQSIVTQDSHINVGKCENVPGQHSCHVGEGEGL